VKSLVNRLLVIYYSVGGNTKRMAEEIRKGAEKEGVFVEIKRVEDCSLNDLDMADGIVIGSPTYFSNIAWQLKKLIDESIELYRKDHKLKDKVGGCFTSSGTQGDGENCIRMMELAFGLHHRLKMIPGIISMSGEADEVISETCQLYGKDIAKKIRVL